MFRHAPSLMIAASLPAGLLLLAQQFWQWEVERVDVKTDTYLVLVHRWGKDLPEDEMVAPDDSYKGVMLAVKQEGRHFVVPVLGAMKFTPWSKWPPANAWC